MKRHRLRWSLSTAALAAAGSLTAALLVSSAAPPGNGPQEVTVIRTAYGVPHITASNFGSLGYGYGYTFASDDICTMADDYITVAGERSRYFGPDGSYSVAGRCWATWPATSTGSP